MTQQNKPSPVDILNCYFGTLGDCPALVTGAWYTKPCFPHARRNYLCSSAYGRSCRGRSPIAASSPVRLLMCPEGPSGTRGDARLRDPSALQEHFPSGQERLRYQYRPALSILVPAQASAKEPHLGDTSGFRWLGGHESSSCPPPSLGQPLNPSDRERVIL